MDLFNILQAIFGFLTDQNAFAKAVIILLITMYVLFSLVVARQIFILNSIVNQYAFSPIFKILSLLHIVLAIAVLLIAIVSV